MQQFVANCPTHLTAAAWYPLSMHQLQQQSLSDHCERCGLQALAEPTQSREEDNLESSVMNISDSLQNHSSICCKYDSKTLLPHFTRGAPNFVAQQCIKQHCRWVCLIDSDRGLQPKLQQKPMFQSWPNFLQHSGCLQKVVNSPHAYRPY